MKTKRIHTNTRNTIVIDAEAKNMPHYSKHNITGIIIENGTELNSKIQLYRPK